jgi:FKBP-type peptidyl-prolyl cis-trans isomerase 2
MSNEGKKVKVHYTGTLDDGTKFDSSYDRNEPLAFTCMAGQMIRGFDKAVRDMEVGDTVNVRLAPDEAYGERVAEAVQTLPIANMPGSENLTVGMKVQLAGPGGRVFPALVTKVEDGMITFDMNHEMAGKYLNFEITLLEAN